MAEQGKAFRLVLVRWASSGKSASGDTILGKDEFPTGRRRYKCVSQHGQVSGRKVTIVDTPGWTHDTSESTQREVLSSCVPAPDVILLLIPLNTEITESYIQSVTDHLFLFGDEVWSQTIVLFTYGTYLGNQTIECHSGGTTKGRATCELELACSHAGLSSSKFTLAVWNSVQKYISLLGERAWEYVIVLFTGGDVIEGMDKKPFLISKGESLQMLLEKCRNRYHFFNNRNRGKSTQVSELLEGIEKLASQNNPSYYEIDKKY
ncbi:GTPase IMAP family member 9-like [Antennarius striatus]|uniref:GTPase IMAP family member 9-like n=1 Tax=Antennarius striatus TaxID=241820 RepID=UPI0035AFB558